MKRIITIIIIAFVAISSIWAQDIIVTTDAQKIEAKILEVSKSEIKYKEKDNIDGPTFILETKEISSIIYANGKVVLYNQSNTQKEEKVTNEPSTTEISQPTSNVSEANEYNCEILLLSGQIIKAKIMEKANNYVAYTFNGKYFTLPASQVEKVTDLRNGEVTAYSGKNLSGSSDTKDKESKVTSTQDKGGRIYRDNGHYMRNEIYISSKEVERILQKENSAAYKQWEKANSMVIGGAVCTGIGGGLVIGGLISLISKNHIVCLGMECGAVVPLSVGLGLTLGASSHYDKAIDIYNSKYDKAAVQLKWHVAPTEVGLAIAF